MLRSARILSYIPALLLLTSACGSLTPQGLERGARAGVKHVYLIPVGTPERAEVQIMNPIGAGFGVVGNFIESRRSAGANQEMQSTLQAAHFDFRTSLSNSVAAAVGKAGFRVTRIAGQRPDKERARFLPKYPPLKRADAYLDVYATFVGFQAPRSSMEYRPRLEIVARLVRTRDNRTVFQDRIVYGYADAANDNADIVKADDNLSFRNRAALTADPNRTARALQSAIDAVSWELARQFM